MRRRRETPKAPLLNDRTASQPFITRAGLDRGAPPPPAPPPVEARIFVYRLMLVGASREKIADMGSASVPPFGRELVFRLYAEICRELGDAANLPEHSRDMLRAQAVERLRNELVGIRTRRMAPGINVEQYTACTREARHLESLLADLEGTRQPIEVDINIDMDVRVRSATMRIVSDLTVNDYVEMGRELAGLLPQETE